MNLDPEQMARKHNQPLLYISLAAIAIYTYTGGVFRETVINKFWIVVPIVIIWFLFNTLTNILLSERVKLSKYEDFVRKYKASRQPKPVEKPRDLVDELEEL